MPPWDNGIPVVLCWNHLVVLLQSPPINHRLWVQIPLAAYNDKKC